MYVKFRFCTLKIPFSPNRGAYVYAQDLKARETTFPGRGSLLTLHPPCTLHPPTSGLLDYLRELNAPQDMLDAADAAVAAGGVGSGIKPGSSSKYRGVSWHERSKRWEVRQARNRAGRCRRVCGASTVSRTWSHGCCSSNPPARFACAHTCRQHQQRLRYVCCPFHYAGTCMGQRQAALCGKL